jgi:hypothetical protein
MKQKDIALIIVIIFLSAVVSLVLSNLLISNPKNRQTKVEVVEKITTDFTPPDAKYFNGSSVNPTKLIRIGDNSNPTPFNTH